MEAEQLSVLYRDTFQWNTESTVYLLSMWTQTRPSGKIFWWVMNTAVWCGLTLSHWSSSLRSLILPVTLPGTLQFPLEHFTELCSSCCVFPSTPQPNNHRGKKKKTLLETIFFKSHCYWSSRKRSREWSWRCKFTQDRVSDPLD